MLMGSALVLLLRKGLLNASWMRFALTWPNPGRFCSCSDDARDIAAKLWERARNSQIGDQSRRMVAIPTPKDVRRVSTSVLFTLLMFVSAVRSTDR